MKNKRLNFLFWNICRKPLIERIEKLSTTFDVDVLMLCECYISSAEILKAINNERRERSNDLFHFVCENTLKIKIFTTEKSNNFELLQTKSKYLQAFKLKDLNLLIFAVHLPSQYIKPLVQDVYKVHSLNIINEIRELEKNHNCNQIVVMGDFNVNPFHKIMTEHDRFNAVMTKEIAKTSRKVDTNNYPYFYNPMWSFFGDLSKHPAGTYHWKDNNSDNNYRWNMLDQVLISPEITDNLDDDSIRIIESDGVNSLKLSKTSKGHSDHYPIYFSLNF